jgi:Transglycosylase SLT domain
VIKAMIAAAVAIAAFPLLVILLVTASSGGAMQATGNATGPSGEPTILARASIPADYLTWYVDAAMTCPGLPWSVLAGIGEVETDHGRSDLPGVHSGKNAAGAEGPMQFLPGTFSRFAVNADPGQPVSPYDPADAIYTAARMLCASGARGGKVAGLEQAIFAYNHAGWYVSEVMSWAGKYAAQDGSGPVATAFAMVLLGKPYRSGAGDPDGYDCSGQVIQAPETGEDVQTDPLSPACVVVAIRPADLTAQP